MKTRRLCCSLVMVLLCSDVSAAEVSGALGVWLRTVAGPHMVELLGNHPRFKGEPVRIMAMKGGQPIEATDQLTDQIRTELTHRLLAETDVRIPLSPRGGCRSAGVYSVLGVELVPDGSRHAVTVAMLDVDEGIWINGSLVKWSGRLDRGQKNLARRTIRRVSSVFAVDQTDAIAEELVDQWSCNNLIASPVFVSAPDNWLGTAILHDLRWRLRGKTLLSDSRDQAATHAELRLPAQALGNVSVHVVLPDGPVLGQRVASVAVSGLAPGTPSPSGFLPAPADALLSELQTDPDQRLCRGEDCIDVSTELLQSAYVLPFYTRDGAATPLGCSLESRQRPGELRFGIHVPASSVARRPSVGFYVLAVNDATIARRLQKHLVRAGGKCSSNSQDTGQWVVGLQEIVRNNAASVSWRAIHMRRDSGGISVL